MGAETNLSSPQLDPTKSRESVTLLNDDQNWMSALRERKINSLIELDVETGLIICSIQMDIYTVQYTWLSVTKAWSRQLAWSLINGRPARCSTHDVNTGMENGFTLITCQYNHYEIKLMAT
ncbi:uncharacterized protein [Triticum aestivum]|uniref:uncharacterized protein isoform X1 n=1 Tax=Triticum aestivum TaxID=4565 RepID=UPI001D029AF8|nr:uncharacterized protein LOC123104276 isoform X1 [Triticum aestivum]